MEGLSLPSSTYGQAPALQAHMSKAELVPSSCAFQPSQAAAALCPATGSVVPCSRLECSTRFPAALGNGRTVYGRALSCCRATNMCERTLTDGGQKYRHCS